MKKSTSLSDSDQSISGIFPLGHEQRHLFARSDHASRTLSKICTFVRQEYLCDVVFVLRQKETIRRLPAHRLIVSTVSEQFQALLENNKQRDIFIDDIDAETFEQFILYAYQGSVDIQNSNAASILTMAHQYGIKEIVDAVGRFLEKQLQIHNCLSIFRLAFKHNFSTLLQNVWQFILDNFSEIVQNNREFFDLSFDELSKLLASDLINVPTEEQVYEALCRWIDHQPTRKTDRLSQLLSLIRLPLLDKKYLTEYVDNNERFKDDHACQLLIFETMRYHLAPEKRSKMQSIKSKPRKSTMGSLFCLGGTENSKTLIERYDFRTDRWNNETMMKHRLSHFACVQVEQKLFVCGGQEGSKILNSVEIYDIPSRTWSIGTPMTVSRHDFAIGSIGGGPFYAIGGHDGRCVLDTVERYDPEIASWTIVCSMSNVRLALAVEVLDYRIYAVGGHDTTTCLREVEAFDPHTNRWIPCASMSKRRAHPAVTSYNGYLYVMGGQEMGRGNKMIVLHDSCERYDPRTNQWTSLVSFSRPKDTLGIVAIQEKFYIVGGFSGRTVDDMDVLDVETEQWGKCSSLKVKRTTACLVHVPNSIKISLDGKRSTSNENVSSVRELPVRRLVLT